MSMKLPLACLLLLPAGFMFGQQVISAHSGVIQYVEGQVVVAGSTIEPKFGLFPDVKSGQTLAAQDGRAEVLLTPGVFLRLSENSSVRMISNQLADTRVEAVSGTSLFEVGELLSNNAITVVFKDAEVSLKKGLYRFDAESSTLRVYQGEAKVTSGSHTLVARRGREIEFGQTLAERSFDLKNTDAFYRWSERRDEYVADANIISAKTAGDQGFVGGTGLFNGTSSYAGAGSGYGGWAWNPYFGMFTFMPAAGVYYSPFGSAYYSPAMVGYAYANVAPQSLLGVPASTVAPKTLTGTPLGSSTSSSILSPRSVSSGSSSGAALSPSLGRGRH